MFGPAKTKILFLGTNLLCAPQLAVTEEFEAIRAELRAGDLRDAFELTPRFGLTVDRLPAAIMEADPHIVHMSGHGTDDGDLMFAGPNGGAVVTDLDTIAGVFGVPGSSVRCVVLNSCSSKDQAEAIAEHVDAVVGMGRQVSEGEAIAFASGFYEGLGYGRSVAAAFENGWRRINLEEGTAGDVPVLFSRDGIDARDTFLWTSDLTPSSKTIVRLEISGDFREFDSKQRLRLEGALRVLTDNPDLRILEVKPGSIVLTLQVSEQGARELMVMHERGELSSKLGVIVSGVQVDVVTQSRLTKPDKSRSTTDESKTRSSRGGRRPSRSSRPPKLSQGGGRPPRSKPDDLVLLERWRSGDRRAGDKLVAIYFPLVRSYFVNKLHEEHEDLVQETFMRLLSDRDKFSGEASFQTYLFGIARYVLYERLRRRYKKGRFEPATSSIADLAGPRPPSLMAQREDHRLLLDGLRAISLEDQDLLELYYWQKLTGRELSSFFGVPEATVRSRIRRALRRLSEAFFELRRIPHDRELGEEDFERWLEELREVTGISNSR